MKKGFLVLLTVFFMLASRGVATLAEEEEPHLCNIYFELAEPSYYHFNSPDQIDDYKLNSYIMGIMLPARHFKIGLESYEGKIKSADINKVKFRSDNIMFGWALINNEVLRLDATFAHHKFNAAGPESPICKGWLPGFDFKVRLTEHWDLNGFYEYSNSGTWHTSVGDDVTAMIRSYGIRCNWMPIKDIGFTAGYRNYSYHSGSIGVEHNISGFYCGIICYYGFGELFDEFINDLLEDDKPSYHHRESRK